MDVIKVSKAVNAPLPYVYSWCTDFRSDDPKITGSTSERIVLQKTRKRVIYTQIYTGADGKRKVGLSIVTLRPPRSWHLDFFGEEDDETGEYRLKSLGKDKTRLDMVFREKWKKAMVKVPSVEEQVKNTDRVWDKYIAALEKEYSSKMGKQ